MNYDFQAIIVNENEAGLPCGQGNGVLIDRDRGIVSTVAHGLKRGSKCKVFLKDGVYNATFRQDAVNWSMDLALVTLDDFGSGSLPPAPVVADAHDGDDIIIPGYMPQEGSTEMGILRSYYNLNISKEICPASVTGKIVAMHQTLACMDIDAFLQEVAEFEQNGKNSLEKSRLFYEDYIILEIEGLNQRWATGLSGSPVVDNKGEIVGIFSIILNDGNFKMGAAIPFSEAKQLVSEFVDNLGN